MPLRHAALLLVLALVMVGCGTAGLEGQDWATANQVLEQVNEVRTSGVVCGTDKPTPMPAVAALKLDASLVVAAKRHSDDMASTGTLSHTGSDGSSPAERIKDAGYEAATWGENAAAAGGDASRVVQLWTWSVGHCRNMMSANYTEMGAAGTGNYWTLVLARPR